MNLGIIGYGVVGQATDHVFQKLGHATFICDIHKTSLSFREVAEQSDIIFICTPELVVPVILNKLNNYSGITVIRSTIPPDTVNWYRYIHIAHNPEFLREKTSLEDALNPRFIIIGTVDGYTEETLCKLYASLKAPIYVMAPEESVMLKLWANAKLACNISFGNEMTRLCEKVGANAHLINNILSQRPLYRGHPWHVGEKYDGKCLPKDLDQLIDFAEKEGVQTPLLKAVKQVNETL